MIFFFPSHFWQCRSGERPAGKVLGRRAAFNHGESGEVRSGGQPGHMLPARMMNGSGDEWVNAVSQAQLRLPPVHRVDHRRDGAPGASPHIASPDPDPGMHAGAPAVPTCLPPAIHDHP